MSHFITSIAEISSRYSTYLIDISGIIHNGMHPLNEAISTINYLIKQKKTLFSSPILLGLVRQCNL